MGLTGDQQAALDLHNQARAAVGNGPLVWDANLQASAQNWANSMAATNNFDHDPSAGGQGQGENIAWFSPPAGNDLTRSTQMWLNEKAAYLAGTESYDHYTQAVWGGTTAVGMGANNGYIAARYTPAGNVVGNGATPYPQDGNRNPTNAGGNNGNNGGGGAGGDTGPDQNSPNGLVLFNVFGPNNAQRSAVGWYKHVGNVIGHQPDAIVQFSYLIKWEGSCESATFPDKNTFKWDIQADAQTKAFANQVGTGSNNSQSYAIFKDDQHLVFNMNGEDYKTIYWCQ